MWKPAAAFAVLLVTFGVVFAQSSGAWPMYIPEELPARKVLTIEQVAALGKGTLLEGVYLTGEFHVTAAGQNRIILRAEPLKSRQPIRVIVEYPEGYPLPPQNSHVSRDANRPYLVTQIRSTDEGHVNIYAREIIKN